ncbi:hypothetical protein [Nonomuraea typhae]|uniref:Uncharacterized protein n=1 Tax=Nonomuraea typhae TaxID=2603600 RepID=A0ABW7YV60_9ACTN
MPLITFTATPEDLRILAALARDAEDATDVIRRALRLLDSRLSDDRDCQVTR